MLMGSQEGDVDIVKGIIKGGVSINAKLDKQGRTVLLLLNPCKKRQHDILNDFISHQIIN